ncbi:MAG TPA: isoprenylcysteine carboxylmethyltransferase family protein [Ramlibacter sp.]|uniref:methyltransferase family protein n=1 Tax=Ramlibacter sp. TaxID=1917967 RepID=UPI002D7EC1F1|nr:isoprenylcysteine carboxylmethyltransferase family protein [Ramlibacter sp.]HET8745255.1 isoprenylcysteine carboxylmethyltransferase family protein [Ramlibacter sp.]
MQSSIAKLIEAGWFVFIAYWAIQARAVKSTARSEPFFARLLKYWLPLMVGTVLVLPWRGGEATLLRARFVPSSHGLPLLGVLLLWAGVAFAIWARATLGRNWSAVVQVKRDHELIERGPYRWVRHPIYTGLLMAYLGTTFSLGEWRGLLGTAIVGVSFWFKLKLEERWMREQFGARYEDYMRRVRALLPGVL